MADRFQPDSPYLVPFDGSFSIEDAPTRPPRRAPSKREAKAALAEVQHEIRDLQHRLYAEDRHALLLVFQAMDAAGKDGTIRAVMSGVNPAGCQVSSFKAPSAPELDQDFLWRVQRALPQRGRIGIFNRSHYEEVLVVRVHPEFLEGQRLPSTSRGKALWRQRYESIRGMEKHLDRNGTVILKFWLNVSAREQAERFLDRIDEPESNWKFSPADVAESERWDDYMEAYEDALNATSRSWAPWYAIPADDKHFMRLQVATILRDTLRAMELGFPRVGADRLELMAQLRPRIAARAGRKS